jgi:hypothetical protein
VRSWAGLGVPGLISVTIMSPTGQSRADLSYNRIPGAAHGHYSKAAKAERLVGNAVHYARYGLVLAGSP